ncbi:MAG: LmeA family phospholipid-binding protein, partial [Gammaproteobacteria bacterium]
MKRVLAIVAGTLCLASCATALDKRAEALIAQALPSALGPAARYDVEVEGARSLGASFARVRAVGTRVDRPDTPVIDRLQADLRNVVVDRETRRLTSIGSARVQAQILAQDLAAWLGDSGWIENARVSLDAPAGIVVTGMPQLAGFPVPGAVAVEFRGRVQARGSQLRLRVDEVRLAGFSAPAFARALLEEVVNPLFDTSSYAVPSMIDTVHVDGGALVVSASGTQVTAPGITGG